MGIPPELLNLKGEIAKICGGLPLLIVKLVEQLSHKDETIEDWSTVLVEKHDIHIKSKSYKLELLGELVI